MKIRFPEVDQPFARLVHDVGIADVPFVRNCPVENWGIAGDLTQRKRDRFPKQTETTSHTISGNAPTERIQALDKGVSGRPLFSRVYFFQQVNQESTDCSRSISS